MQVPAFSRPRLRLPTASHPWLELAVSTSLWLLLFLFGSALIARGGSVGAGSLREPLTTLDPWQVSLILALVGFFSGAALSPRLRLRSLGLSVFGISVLWTATLFAFQIRYGLSGTIPLLWFGILGLVLGTTAGALSARRMWWPAQKGKVDGRPLAYLALACALILTLAPFSPDNPLIAPFSTPGTIALITQVPEQLYRLIKAVMLWIPPGFVLAAGNLAKVPRRWAPPGVAGFFLVGWPFFGALTAGDLGEILAAPIGLWVGLWLGERTGSFEETVDARAPESSLTAHGPAIAAAPRPSKAPGETAEIPSASSVPAPVASLAYRLRPAFALPRPEPLALLPSLGLLAIAGWGWWDFPRFHLPLGIALLLYLLSLLVFRHAWLVAIPALLPILDLAPWTGRFFFDESDLFLLVTLGAALLHRPDPQAGPYLARPAAALAGFFVITTLIALIGGVLPLSPLDANAFASYFSHFNALRIGKGFAWGFAFFLLLRWTVPRGSEIPARLFTAGILLGLLGVILIGVRERWQFADLLDFAAAYRITASFSSMHTGGSHLPGFLALAVPFVWLWAMQRRNPFGLLVGLPLLAGAVYLVISTVTRASVLALVVELVLLTLFWLRSLRGRGARIAVPIFAFGSIAAVVGGLLFLGTQGSYFQQRMATVERDADTRLEHWRSAFRMMDQDFSTQVFGMGLGTFPETYLQRNSLGRVPGNFRYASENGNRHLLLGSGETLYLAQKVGVQPGTEYRLAFDLRGDAKRVRLTMPLCEKHLLDSRDCVWNTYQVPGSGRWEHKEAPLNSKRIGRGNLLSRPPVELFLYNDEENQVVAVDNLSLRAPDGTELIRNGDFSAGGDFWFFKTHDHLAWHIKNLWASLLFEQGWAGLAAFNLLILGVFLHLAGPAWRGGTAPAATLSAIAGFLALGLFSSPFDAPRLTALFFAVVAVGLHAAPAVAVVARERPLGCKSVKFSDRSRFSTPALTSHPEACATAFTNIAIAIRWYR